jgi:peptidoglycan/LPS O-acetylase OafA/YrhL
MRPQRFDSLDGLRGVAALTVVVFHFFSAYVPGLLSDQTDTPWWGSDTPLAVLFNGGFAVSVFFVLSGFVIANSAAQRKAPFVVNVLRRYGRLAVPVAASTVIAWALLAASPHTVAQLKAAQPHIWLNQTYDGTEPDLWAAVRSGFIDVFANGYSYFNNVLWTMQIEIVGSIAIYAIYGLASPRFQFALLVAMALAAVVVGWPEYSAFALGGLMREALAADRLPSRFAWAALAFGVVVGAMTPGYPSRLGLPLSDEGQFALGESHKVWQVLAALGLVYAVLGLPWLGRCLSSRPLRFLGGISFGVYLVHAPLLYTVFATPYLAVRTDPAAVAALLLAFLAVAVTAGYGFTRAVDQPTIGALRRLRLRRWRLGAAAQQPVDSTHANCP